MRDERVVSAWMGTVVVFAICFCGWLSTKGMDREVVHLLVTTLSTIGGIVFASSKIRQYADPNAGGGGGYSGGSSLPPPSMAPTKRPPGLPRIIFGALAGMSLGLGLTLTIGW